MVEATGKHWAERGKTVGGLKGPFRLRLPEFSGEIKAGETGLSLN